MTTNLIAAAATVALLGAGFASTEGTRSAQALPMQQVSLAAEAPAGGDKCRVDVVRTGVNGAADIARYVEKGGQCVCVVTTGAAAGNGNAEQIVVDLLRDRTCNGAPAPAGLEGQAAAGSGGGSIGVILPVVVTAVGATGLAAAAGNDSKG